MFTLSYSDVDNRKFVSSRRKLAEALGCSEITVSRMLIEPGNPGTKPNGSYELDVWRNYFAARSARQREQEDDTLVLDGKPSINAEIKQEQLAFARAKRRKAELDLQAREGELIELSDVENTLYGFASKLAATHKRAATVDLFNEICSSVAVDKAGASALLEILENFHTAFCEQVQKIELKQQSE